MCLSVCLSVRGLSSILFDLGSHLLLSDPCDMRERDRQTETDRETERERERERERGEREMC